MELRDEGWHEAKAQLELSFQGGRGCVVTAPFCATGFMCTEEEFVTRAPPCPIPSYRNHIQSTRKGGRINSVQSIE